MFYNSSYTENEVKGHCVWDLGEEIIVGHETMKGSKGSTESSSYIESNEEPLLTKSLLEEGEISSENYGPLCYNQGPRYFKDIAFLILFVIFVLSTFGFGIFSVAHRNKNYGKLDDYVYISNSSSCARYMFQNKPNPLEFLHEKLNPLRNLENNENHLENFGNNENHLENSENKENHFENFYKNQNHLQKSGNQENHFEDFDKNPNPLGNYENEANHLGNYENKQNQFGFLSLSENHKTIRVLELDYHHVLESFGLTSKSTKHFVRDLVWVLVITLLLSIPIASSLLHLLKSFTKQLVYACLPFFVLIPLFINIFWFVACMFSSECKEYVSLALRIFIFVFVLVLCGIITWIIIANWHRVEITIRIMRTASQALASNLGLLVVLPCLKFGLLVYYVPIVVFLVFARWNGKIVPNPKVVEYGYTCGGSTGVDCCLWKEDSWVPVYYALAIITMLWSLAWMIEAQIYILSGTIAQWYFCKDASRPPKSIRSSIRNAFGPSFGTITFSGMIFGVVRVIRSVIDNARNEAQQGVIYTCLRCCADLLLSSIDFVNKFTINFAAITGESYCSSAKMSYELLKRNLLSAVVVETISTRILFGIMFVVTVVYAILVCAILKASTSLQEYVYVITIIAWAVLFLILFYFVHVLDNVVDTIYICYAMDKDTGSMSKPEIHDVYVHLPVSRSDNSVFSIHHV